MYICYICIQLFCEGRFTRALHHLPLPPGRLIERRRHVLCTRPRVVQRRPAMTGGSGTILSKGRCVPSRRNGHHVLAKNKFTPADPSRWYHDLLGLSRSLTPGPGTRRCSNNTRYQGYRCTGCPRRLQVALWYRTGSSRRM